MATNEMLKIQQLAIQLWEADQQAFSASEKSAKKLGAVLIQIRESMSHGRYTPWLKKNGIDRNRANYCMRVASGKQKAKKKTSSIPEGYKRVSILLKAPLYERLALIAKADGAELGRYVSRVVAEHAVAQKQLANEILAAIASENKAREQAVKQGMEERAAAATA